MRLGIDVGGTFTDFVLIDDRTGKILYTKTPTTPKDLAEGVLTGIEKILRLAGATMADVEYIVHGTTIGTNALIERKGAKVGLITTEGFRDVLEIARIERPDAGLYDIHIDMPDPLVPRDLRLEVAERIGADGLVVRPLDGASVRRAVEALEAEGVEAIAVCLLFSFRNPTHERAVRQICSELYPQVPVSLSCEIAPEFREFERTSTTVINAYLSPITERYLQSLILRLPLRLPLRSAQGSGSGQGFPLPSVGDFVPPEDGDFAGQVSNLHHRHGDVDVLIMQASGGAMAIDVAKSRAVNMVNSGPAGGALATALFGRLTGDAKIIGVDMGGTSFDIGLIVDGRPRVKSEGEFEGYPVKIPMIDVEGIGAGGGSIAWVDAGGALSVGPESAGADPGPACYGRGGTRPTVTDANLVLGRLNPDYFLGAEMKLHVDRAHQAIRQAVAEPLGLSAEEAASGIIRIVNANMVRGISVNSTQKGYDVREFSLLAFGGAGPLHAVELAQELGMRRVIVPPLCSVFSAFGAVASDVRHDHAQTAALSQKSATAEALQAGFAELEAQARRQLSEERVPADRIAIDWAADLRYEGQSYELTVPITKGARGTLTESDVAEAIRCFHDLHQRIYAYGEPNEAVEFVSLRVAVIGRAPEVKLSRRRKMSGAPRLKSERPVYFPALGRFVSTKVFERDELRAGQRFSGPCLIEETTSTTVIPPGWTGSLDEYGSLIIEPVRAVTRRAVGRRASAKPSLDGRRAAAKRSARRSKARVTGRRG